MDSARRGMHRSPHGLDGIQECSLTRSTSSRTFRKITKPVQVARIRLLQTEERNEIGNCERRIMCGFPTYRGTEPQIALQQWRHRESAWTGYAVERSITTV